MGTIKVRKANRIIRVTENELDKYLANGYEIIKQPIMQDKQPSNKVVAAPAEEKPAEPVVETPKRKTTKRRK